MVDSIDAAVADVVVAVVVVLSSIGDERNSIFLGENVWMDCFLPVYLSSRNVVICCGGEEKAEKTNVQKKTR